MEKISTLDDALQHLSDLGNASCVGYDLCMKACPVVDDDIVIAELNDAADDPSQMTAAVRQFTLDCVQCGRCTTACPAGAPRDHMMLKLRAEMPDRPDAYDRYGLMKGGNKPWYVNALQTVFEQTARGKVDARIWPHLDKTELNTSDTLLYFGCYAFSDSGSASVTLDLAEHLGVDYEIVAGLRTCCGWPQYLSGDLGRAEELMGALGELIAKVDPEVVVSGCAECVAAVQVIAKQRGARWESISVVDWLRRHKDQLDLAPSDDPLTFHDSCHLSRKMGRGDAARELMDGVFPLTEIEESGDQGLCCGYYGFNQNEAKTTALRERRIAQARATGTGRMAVECVTCLEAYHKVDNEGVEVVELQKLVLDAVRKP